MQYPPVLPGPDLNYLIHQVSPFVGLILMFVGVRWLLRSPVGEAFAERVRQRSLGRWGVAGGGPRRGGAVEGSITAPRGRVPGSPTRLNFPGATPPAAGTAILARGLEETPPSLGRPPRGCA